MLAGARIDPGEWQPLLRMAVESLRGAFAANVGAKKQFTEAVLSHMRATGAITTWEFVGTRQRQDYRVVLPTGKQVSIEAKGCGDGNNTGIWDRPAWAEEFIIWSQCPESLQHDPGDGVWSALATRILSKEIAGEGAVDAFVFFDGRCGSTSRRCPKNPQYGVEGELRGIATDVAGQDGRLWLPPPCIYLLPRSVPVPVTNPNPPLHTLETCQFAAAMMQAFNVPLTNAPTEVHWARVAIENRAEGRFYQVTVGTDLSRPRSLVEGRWKRLRRE